MSVRNPTLRKAVILADIREGSDSSTAWDTCQSTWLAVSAGVRLAPGTGTKNVGLVHDASAEIQRCRSRREGG